MHCPDCRDNTMRVVRSVPVPDYPAPYTIRQRQCTICKVEITTQERICGEKDKGDK